MQDKEYVMENDEEFLRLDIKTDTKVVKKQALWAGIETGMRVADIGCGSGKTTSILHKLVQPDGVAIGVDGSKKRIEYAKERYGVKRIEFKCKDIPEPLNDLGVFDFVWVRFLLEYYRSTSLDIVKNISAIVKPGGVLCLIDLDFNWMKKFEVISRKIHFNYEEYEGGYEEFLGEFNRFFVNPRRFTYTPVICCRGRKPTT